MSFKTKIERARKEAGDPSDRAQLKKILTKLFDDSACPAWPTEGILDIFPHETTCRIPNASGIGICGTIFSNTSNLRSHVSGVHLPKTKTKRAKHLKNLELYKARMGALSFGLFNEALNMLENRIDGNEDYDEEEDNVGREIRNNAPISRKKSIQDKTFKSAEHVTESDDGEEEEEEEEEEDREEEDGEEDEGEEDEGEEDGDEEEENGISVAEVEENRESSPLSSVGDLTDAEEEIAVAAKRYSTRSTKN